MSDIIFYQRRTIVMRVRQEKTAVDEQTTSGILLLVPGKYAHLT